MIPTNLLQNRRRSERASNRRHAATRGTFAAPQPIAVSRKQMFIPVHAKRGRFAAPFSLPAQKQPLRGPKQILSVQIVQKAPPRSTLNDPTRL
jgi:hypothetical protein